MIRVLVTGSESPAGQDFIRWLQMASGQVHIIAADQFPLGSVVSKAEEHHLLPPAGSATFTSSLNDLVDETRAVFVHAQRDDDVCSISRDRNRLGARTFLPSHATVQLCSDDFELNCRLRELGIIVPQASGFEDRESLGRVVDEFLKANGGATLCLRRGSMARATVAVASGTEAEAWIDTWGANHGLAARDFMVREPLPGRAFVVRSLWWRGRLVASEVYEPRGHPFQSFGSNCNSASGSAWLQANDHHLRSTATHAVRAADPHANGIFCVELKGDVDGALCVADITVGRFLACGESFRGGGYNLPLTFVRLGLDVPIGKESPTSATGGRHYHQGFGPARESRRGLPSVAIA